MNCYTPELPPPGDPRFALRARMAFEQLVLLLRGFCRDGQAFSISGDVTLSGAFSTDSTITLTPVTAPATPAAGHVLYVDAADNKLKSKGQGGTVTPLANP